MAEVTKVVKNGKVNLLEKFEAMKKDVNSFKIDIDSDKERFLGYACINDLKGVRFFGNIRESGSELLLLGSVCDRVLYKWSRILYYYEISDVEYIDSVPFGNFKIVSREYIEDEYSRVFGVLPCAEV
jgi:hypothetical protein